MILPVIRLLKQEPSVSCRIISFCEFRRLHTPTDLLQKENIPYRIMPGLKFKGTSASTGSRGLGGNKSSLRNILRDLIWLFRLKKSVVRVINDRPALVIIPNDISYPLTKTIAILKKRKIPFILFQEGIRFPLPNEFEDTQYGTNGAAEIFAWGNFAKRYFEKITGTVVKALGNPRLDESMQEHRKTEPLSMKEGIKLLYVSNPVDDQGFCTKKEKISLFVSFLLTFERYFLSKKITLLVKLHGRENESEFRQAVESSAAKTEIMFVNQHHLFSLFRISDAVVILASTAGLEAMLFDKPVGVIKLPGHGYVFDYVKEQAAVGIDLEAGDETAMSMLMEQWAGSDKNRAKEFATDHVSNAGSSAVQYKNEILKFLATQR